MGQVHVLAQAGDGEAAAEAYLAGFGRHVAGEDAHEGCFAGAVGAEQADAFPFVDGEGDAGEDGAFEVGFGEGESGQDRGARAHGVCIVVGSVAPQGAWWCGAPCGAGVEGRGSERCCPFGRGRWRRGAGGCGGIGGG